ncbi:dioxygenase [Actinomadura sp. KC345]|uniref:dioxygenase family protein n=1 Tax=Actinomadura sp. KC345 TaxID=2530371 RepID=UPI001054106D|nr:dioxygenase [Actinomadura sp. KC345]
MDRMPVLYLSHGAPPLADDQVWTDELARWSAELPKPEAVLMVSAHWEEAPLSIGATRRVPLVYDFWGFPERYFKVRYDAPGAPGLADEVRGLVPGVHQDEERGLDHGAYVPLVEMYPDADVPVLQMSMPTLEPARLFEIGRSLAPLRDQGVLIVGSGFTTHNLSRVDVRLGSDTAPEAWSAEFDEWAEKAVEGGDVDALLDFRAKAPAAGIAHPRTEHFAPLFMSLGADADDPSERRSVVDGYWYGLAKRSFQFG